MPTLGQDVNSVKRPTILSIMLAIVAGLLGPAPVTAQSRSLQREPLRAPECSFRSATTCWTLRVGPATRPVSQPPKRAPERVEPCLGPALAGQRLRGGNDGKRVTGGGDVSTRAAAPADPETCPSGP